MSDEEKQKACWQKKRFFSEDQAKFSQKLIGKRHGYEMEIYICPFCNFYHLTRKKEIK